MQLTITDPKDKLRWWQHKAYLAQIHDHVKYLKVDISGDCVSGESAIGFPADQPLEER